MEIVDYDKKMIMINDFYEQACEIRNMVHDSIKGFHYIHNFDLLSDKDPNDVYTREINFSNNVERRKKQLLIELGRAGEYAIKYILLLKQMKDYPNQSFEEFKTKAIYNLGVKGVRNTYINQYNMDSKLISEILEEAEKHKLQPLHDYSYLYAIVKHLYPEIVQNIHKYMLFSVKSYYSEISQILNKNLKKIVSLFPQIDFMASFDIKDDDKKSYKDGYDKVISEAGDSFIRLRYIENNPDNKKYDLISILSVLDYLIDFIEIIKEINLDNLDKEIGLSFTKSKFYELAIAKASEGVSPLKYMSLGIEKFKSEKKIIDYVFTILENNPEIINAVDYAQIKIYTNLSQKELSVNDIYTNFLYNIIENKQNQNLLKILPLLLDPTNTKKILSILSLNGADINNLDNSYKKVLCFPVDYFERAFSMMQEKGEKLVNEDGSLNQKIYSIIESIRIVDKKNNDFNETPPLPLRNRK